MTKFLTLFLLSLLVTPLAANAQTAEEHAKAQLISAYDGVGNLPVIDMALDITLNHNFYTYWRMPGDNGLAPVFDWTGSENVKDVSVAWPTPKRFTMFDMHSFGYSDGVVFPLSVTPNEIGKPIVLHLKLDLMVCHEICIPQTITMMRIFKDGEAVQSENFQKIQMAKRTVPAKDNTATLGIDTAILGKDAVVITAFGASGWGENADLIIETANGMLTAKPEILPPETEGGKSVLKIKGPDGVDLTKELFGKTVSILLINNQEAVEKTITF